MKHRKQAGPIALALASLFLFLFIALAFVAAPLGALLIGMGIGWIIECLTGDYVVKAFNAVGMNGVKNGDLLKVFGLLAVVIAMVKVGTSNAKSKDATGAKETK